MENRVGYNKIRDGQGASMHQICPDCIGLVLEEMFVQQQDCIGVQCACIYCNTIIPALTSLWLPLVAECGSDSKADSKDFALLVNFGLKHI